MAYSYTHTKSTQTKLECFSLGIYMSKYVFATNSFAITHIYIGYFAGGTIFIIFYHDSDFCILISTTCIFLINSFHLFVSFFYSHIFMSVRDVLLMQGILVNNANIYFVGTSMHLLPPTVGVCCTSMSDVMHLQHRPISGINTYRMSIPICSLHLRFFLYRIGYLKSILLSAASFSAIGFISSSSDK